MALDVYLIAIGGTGMAPLAGLLKAAGHRVRGSDGPLYPPMSDLLAEAGVVPELGFDGERFDDPARRPDVVVVGNAVPRGNPEVLAAERWDLERLSMPQALGRFFLAGRRPLVVAGTHGKTTTSAWAAWTLEACGADPGYLVGGLPLDLERSYRLGGGSRFVVEGDEYNAAYFDRGPKFLHYRPETLVLNSVEHDHADLYPTHADLLAAYRRLLALVPEDGLVVANGDEPGLAELVREAARARVVTFGLGAANTVRPRGLEWTPEGPRFELDDPQAGEVEVALRLPGEHNLRNALAVWTAARADGLPAAAVAAALGRFRGVARRLQELGTAAGVTVVDDFAHHPTAVTVSLGALRRRYPGRRLVAAFEPRSLTAARASGGDAYLAAFAGADVAVFAPVFHAARLAEGERLDLDALVARLSQRGVEAAAEADLEATVRRLLALLRPGDVVVTMSSGAFGGLPRRLLGELAAAAPAAAPEPAPLLT